MKNTENKREGLMLGSQQLLKEFKEYKKHSKYLKQIQDAFFKEGYSFKNMRDVENIILILKADVIEEDDFISNKDDDSDSNQKERKPNIFKNSFFK